MRTEVFQQQQPSIRNLQFDNNEMDQPSFVKDSANHSNPKPKLPSQIINSLNELKDHDFDTVSNATAFYWSKHQLQGSGVRNLTANAFTLHTEQVTNAEA